MDITLLGVGSRAGYWEQNVGNVAIIQPFFRELRNRFPDANIDTTLQFSSKLPDKYNINTIDPVEIGGLPDTVSDEYVDEHLESKISEIVESVPSESREYKRLQDSDIVLVLNGDTFPRYSSLDAIIPYLVDIFIASQSECQILDVAGSPGPFCTAKERILAQAAYGKIDGVSTREDVSYRYLKQFDSDIEVVKAACPAFSLKPAKERTVDRILKQEGVSFDSDNLIGLNMCRFNKLNMRDNSLQDLTLDDMKGTLHYLLDEIDSELILIPHDYRINSSESQTGEDYDILKSYLNYLNGEGYGSRVKLIDGTYTASELKGIIGQLDFFVSGRLHAGAAGYSQGVPTMLLAYAHKHRGFSEHYFQQDGVVENFDRKHLLAVTKHLWETRDHREKVLSDRNQYINDRISKNYKLIETQSQSFRN
jgi:polysaccharide pyruvyl transferase WcaK-like protein